MEKLRVGILGARRGVCHLNNFLALPQAQVIAVADRVPERRERVRERVEAAGGVMLAEYDDLLALRPDAVMVASNAKLQVQHACMALEAGCAVLSEIPGGYTLDELLRLRATVEHTGGFYMLAENTCFWDFFRYWRKWVVEGRFGALSLAEGEYVHYLPHTLEVPSGEYLTPSQVRAAGRSDARPVWRADQPPIQYSTHDLGPLLEVLDDRCVSVTCRSGPWRCAETPLRSDGQFALFETAGGALIRILVTLSCPRPDEHRYRLFGTSGGCEWFLYENFGRYYDTLMEHREGWRKHAIGLAGALDDTSTGHGGADLKVVRAFTDAVLGGQPSPIDVYRAIEYALPGILAAESADLGGVPVPIPNLRRERFSGTRFWDCLGLPQQDPPLVT
ncbi:MAG: Gfo/Idh/MocA family oxidoreductase [Fimbriimonadaceae bacterium]|nr:Gfo/Idh/MocA family oxidoreductase [Fimbriimonadaceae bacterium]